MGTKFGPGMEWAWNGLVAPVIGLILGLPCTGAELAQCQRGTKTKYFRLGQPTTVKAPSLLSSHSMQFRGIGSYSDSMCTSFIAQAAWL